MAVADRLRAVQIKANLIADKKLGLMEIEVDVHDGIALLTGEVSSEEEKHSAEELAYDIDGIHEVQNDIRVLPISFEEMLANNIPNTHLGYGPAEGNAGDLAYSISDEATVPGPGAPSIEQFPGEFSDDEIDLEVAKRLHSQQEFDTSKVHFYTMNQIVHLTGEIKTSDELNGLQEMLLNLQGVMGISSEVTVQQGETGTPME